MKVPLQHKKSAHKSQEKSGKASLHQLRLNGPFFGVNSIIQKKKQSASVSSDVIQPVWVNIRQGKVQTNWTAPSSNDPFGGQGIWMTNDEFVMFKNAGKRKGSQKVTDTSTGTTHSPAVLPAGAPSHLLDRSRPDRTQSPIGLYDVEPYNVAQAHEVTGDKMEHDHIPSGQSLMVRATGLGKDPTAAYQNGLTIEIREQDHREFSPTFGGRQRKQDTRPNHTTGARQTIDSELPGAAFHRDVKMMLEGTQTRNYGRPDDLTRVGAYRTLYKRSIKEGRLDPLSPGLGYTVGARNRVSYHPTAPTAPSQGDLIDDMFRNALRGNVANPNGVPVAPGTSVSGGGPVAFSPAPGTTGGGGIFGSTAGTSGGGGMFGSTPGTSGGGGMFGSSSGAAGAGGFGTTTGLGASFGTPLTAASSGGGPVAFGSGSGTAGVGGLGTASHTPIVSGLGSSPLMAAILGLNQSHQST